MGNKIWEFIRQIGIFIVIGQTLLHFRPGEKYEKYLKLLTGLMVVAQFIAPLCSFVGGTSQNAYQANLEQFQKELEHSVSEIDKQWLTYDAQIDEQILKKTDYIKKETQDGGQEESDGGIKIEGIKIEVGG